MREIVKDNLKLLAQAPKGADVVPKIIALLYTAAEADPSVSEEMAEKLADMVRHGSSPHVQEHAMLALVAMKDIPACLRKQIELAREGHFDRLVRQRKKWWQFWK